MIVTTQMIRDKLHRYGPMGVSGLLDLLGVKTNEDTAHVKALLKLAAHAKTINYNTVENVVWVTKQQFKSCE